MVIKKLIKKGEGGLFLICKLLEKPERRIFRSFTKTTCILTGSVVMH
jgi:hypothetical protein